MEETSAEKATQLKEPPIRQVIYCPRCGRDGLMEVDPLGYEAQYVCPGCEYSVSAISYNARDAVRKVVAETRSQSRKNRLSS